MNTATALTLIAAVPALALAQTGEKVTHDRIVAYFRAIPQEVMPAGDTLVTWRADGPILYHTAQRSGNSVRAGMFRNDALIGTDAVEWTSSGPSTFSVRWLGSSPATLEGRVEDRQLIVTGSRQSRSPLPAGLWAVADYGMDDLLLPLIGSLRENAQPVAVFRPFAGKWDTLTVSVTASHGFHVLGVTDAKGKRTSCATDERRQSCLWIQESTSSTERRPLDTTAAFTVYSAIKLALGKLQ